MKGIIELYNGGGYRLVMTTAAAGPVGPSYNLSNENRGRILNRLGLKPGDVHFVHQNHSRAVADISEWRAEPLTEADGIVSGNKNDKLAVTAADCMPVYLHDRRSDVRALLHSGWKGTGISVNAVALMNRKYGSRPSDITAVLGPAIGSCCYNVDDERASVFAAEWGPQSVIERNGGKYISLLNANRIMLEKAGIAEIICVNRCTCCDPLLGSFRRQGAEDFTLMFVLSYLNEL